MRAKNRLPSPFSEAISALNDRTLRRLLGARAFLRGYDYVRRHAVNDLTVEEASAHGRVKGTEVEPYRVSLRITPGGFASECSCPPSRPSTATASTSRPCSSPSVTSRAATRGGRRRGRRRRASRGLGDERRRLRPERTKPERPEADAGGHAERIRERLIHGTGRVWRWASRTTRASGAGVEARRGGACGHGQRRRSARRDGHGTVATGIDAWLPEPMPPMPRSIEYRLQVKTTGQGPGGSLTVTMLDAGSVGRARCSLRAASSLSRVKHPRPTGRRSASSRASRTRGRVAAAASRSGARTPATSSRSSRGGGSSSSRR